MSERPTKSYSPLDPIYGDADEIALQKMREKMDVQQNEQPIPIGKLVELAKGKTQDIINLDETKKTGTED